MGSRRNLPRRSVRAARTAEPLRNIGPVSRRWLSAVGIDSLGELREIGVVDAWLLLRAHGYNVSLNLAWALAGAVLDCDWRDVPETVRHDIRARIEKVT